MRFLPESGEGGQTLQGSMTVGIALAAAFPDALGGTPTTEILRRIADDGFFGAAEIVPPTSAKDRARVAEICEEYGLVLDVDAGFDLYRGGYNLAGLDEGERRSAVRVACAVLDAGSELAAERMSIVSGPDPGEAHRAAAFDALVASVDELYEHAGRRGGIEISLKMADRDVDKRFLVGPTVEGAALARRGRHTHPGFGLVLNLAHLPLLGEDPTGAVGSATPFLARVQIGNCVLKDRSSTWFGDRHPPIGTDGGEIGTHELSRFLAALSDVGYLGAARGLVGFEVRPPPGTDPWETVALGKRQLEHAWRAIGGTKR